jgi:hypothetical protein
MEMYSVVESWALLLWWIWLGMVPRAS